eukprot:365602-Chlamydomonas_euryale.AAC.16
MKIYFYLGVSRAASGGSTPQQHTRSRDLLATHHTPTRCPPAETSGAHPPTYMQTGPNLSACDTFQPDMSACGTFHPKMSAIGTLQPKMSACACVCALRLYMRVRARASTGRHRAGGVPQGEQPAVVRPARRPPVLIAQQVHVVAERRQAGEQRPQQSTCFGVRGCRAAAALVRHGRCRRTSRRRCRGVRRRVRQLRRRGDDRRQLAWVARQHCKAGARAQQRHQAERLHQLAALVHHHERELPAAEAVAQQRAARRAHHGYRSQQPAALTLRAALQRCQLSGQRRRFVR